MISVTIFSTSVLWLSSINLIAFHFSVKLVDWLHDWWKRPSKFHCSSDEEAWFSWVELSTACTQNMLLLSLFAAACYRQVRRIACWFERAFRLFWVVKIVNLALIRWVRIRVRIRFRFRSCPVYPLAPQKYMDCNYLRTKPFLKIYSLYVRFQPRAPLQNN